MTLIHAKSVVILGALSQARHEPALTATKIRARLQPASVNARDHASSAAIEKVNSKTSFIYGFN